MSNTWACFRNANCIHVQQYKHTNEVGCVFVLHVFFSLNVKPLSHYHVSTAHEDTKGTSRVRRTYVSIRSSYSSIRSSYSSYAEVLRFLCVLKIRSTYVAGPIRRTYVTHT